jgi:glycosyltransferase involved in cell wall biosynthesis
MTTKRIKISFIIGSLRLGGAERQVAELAKGLPRDRFDVQICCLSEAGPLEEEMTRAHIPVTVFRFYLVYGKYNLYSYIALIKSFWSIIRHFRRERPDIVHAYLYTAYVVGIICARLAGVPFAISSRRSLGYFKDGKPYKQWLENFVNRFTDLIVANSEGVMRDVLKREKIDRKRLRLIYNGVDIDEFLKPSDVDGSRRELGLERDALAVGVVANLIHYKGHREIITAASILKPSFPHVRFVLVGRDGGVRQQLEEQVRRLGLEREILFAGSQRDIPRIMHAFDILLLASYEEGFSNVLLEGMAAGKPIVATDVGGNAEAVLDHETGIIIPPRNPHAIATALQQLLENPELRRTMGEKGRQRVREHFSRETLIENMTRLYEELLSKKT